MDSIHAATVIPFPRRPGAGPAPDLTTPPLPPADEDAGARLHRALTALDAAVAAQRDAVANWRGALSSLAGSVQAMQGSLQGFGARMGDLRAEVDAVGDTARGLEAWADSAMAASAAPQPK